MYDRIKTKDDRLKVQAAQFEYLLKNGYTQEIYKGLNIFIRDLTMKIFKDTSSNHLLFVRYRTAERMNEAKQNVKDNYDSRNAYKEEAKKNKKKSSHAAAAAAIKAELTSIYPNIKFSVTSESFSMGNSVHVGYTDGPTSNQIDDIIKKYQYGHFNGMEDLYENTNSRDDIPQAKYVSAQRDMSEETKALLMQDAERLFNPDHYSRIYTAADFAHQIFSHCEIPAGASITGIERTGKTCGINSPEHFYKIAFELPEAEIKEVEKAEVKAGTVQIIEYSEKAIAVIGDTKPIKDKLRDLKGSFNFRLTCGPGWIFPKTRLEEVRLALSEKPTEETTLKQEVQKTIEFLADTDKEIYGEITEGTKEAAKVQNVPLPPEYEIYSNLEDITEAAESGKVISLFNLCQLVNQ